MPAIFNTGVVRYLMGWRGAEGFGSTSTCEQVLKGIDLTGKTALITGGTSPIAQHVARHLSLHGATVVLAVHSPAPAPLQAPVAALDAPQPQAIEPSALPEAAAASSSPPAAAPPGPTAVAPPAPAATTSNTSPSTTDPPAVASASSQPQLTYGGAAHPAHQEELAAERPPGLMQGLPDDAATSGPAAVDPSMITLKCDLSTVAGAAELAAAFQALGLPLHMLINNAATYTADFILTPDNLEQHFAVNQMAHYALTRLLLPLMAATSQQDGCECRVVNVSCSAHFISSRPVAGTGRYLKAGRGSSPPQVEGERAGVMWMPAHAYGSSKVAVILTARNLGQRLQQQGVAVTVNAVHPGVTQKGLDRYGGYGQGTWAHYLKAMVGSTAGAFGWLKSDELAAATVVYTAAGAPMAGVTGQYIVDCNPAPASAEACSDIAAAVLSQYCEQFVASRLGGLPPVPGTTGGGATELPASVWTAEAEASCL